MNYGSLFSGIGGLDKGLHDAGHTCLFMAESDPWRRDVLRARFPGVPVYDDVRGVGQHDALGSTPPQNPQRNGSSPIANEHGSTRSLDLLCGGFPCQDLSVAGKRAGLAGERSGLFHEFARIIDAFRPRYALIENVPGLLSSQGGRDFGVVLGTLADLGYGVAWRTLDSRFFGVPQRRRRVFILAALADGDPRAAAERAGEILAVGTRCDRHPAAGGQAGPDVAGASDDGTVSTLQKPQGGWRVDAEGAAGGHLVTASSASVRRLLPVECERLQALPDNWTDPDGNQPDSRRYAALGDAVTASVGEWIGWRLAATA